MTRSSRSRPGSSTLSTIAAIACLMLGHNTSQAIAGYDRISSAKPDDILLRAAIARPTSRSWDKLQWRRWSDYDRVLADDPNYTDAVFNKGNTLVDLGRPDRVGRKLSARTRAAA